MREDGRHEPLVPPDQRPSRVDRLERDAPFAGERPDMADAEAGRRVVDVDLDRVRRSPPGRCGRPPRLGSRPRPGRASVRRTDFISSIQSGWRSMSATISQTASIGASMVIAIFMTGSIASPRAMRSPIQRSTRKVPVTPETARAASGIEGASGRPRGSRLVTLVHGRDSTAAAPRSVPRTPMPHERRDRARRADRLRSGSMYSDDFKQQLPDIDPSETQDWIDSLDQLLDQEGAERARFLAYKLLKRARQRDVGLPPLTQTRYINTISPEQEPAFPGDEAIERRIRAWSAGTRWRWCCAPTTPSAGIGGHLSTYASRRRASTRSASTTSSGARTTAPATRSSSRATPRRGSTRGPSSRGASARTSSTSFRREVVPGRGLARTRTRGCMPDFWEFPTVVDGPRAHLGRSTRPASTATSQHRGIADTSASRVWAFLGDGEMDEPESLGALGIAGRERLDNLIFVVNCNLQRLDGPVRGNGKIIQELEAVFRGAGLERHQGDLGPRVGRAPGPRHRRRARQRR